jgi:HEAT repeat protein
VVEKQTVVVQSEECDEDTEALFEALRHRKSQLLIQLQTGDKEQREDAIKELAGFSFDDAVRQTLENILLSDPDVELRREVIRAFAEVKNTEALPALEKARVEDSEWSVREEADEAIKEIRGY